MMTRILTSVVGIPAILLLLFWPGGGPWFWFVAALMAMGIFEFTRALAAKGIYVHWGALAIVGAATMLAAATRPATGLAGLHGMAAYATRGEILPAIAVIAVLLLLTGETFRQRRAPLRNLGGTLVGMAWLTPTIPYLARLRLAGPRGPGLYEWPYHADPGAWIVLSLLLIIWADDSAAYFVGKAIGKHKMAPEISPNKTWEGSIGGLLASGIVGAAMGTFLMSLPLEGFVLGLIVGAIGQVGDFAKSSIKRELGIKDFSDLLPGHGGVLDRFDSLIFAAPVAYLFLYYGVILAAT